MSKVLIVEPDESIKYLFRTAIHFQKIEVVEASSAAEALVRLDEKPNVVLLDILTPDLKKVNFINEVKEKLGENTPLIIIADMKNQDELAECSVEGACEYLAKSNLKVGDVIRKIRVAVDEKHK